MNASTSYPLAQRVISDAFPGVMADIAGAEEQARIAVANYVPTACDEAEENFTTARLAVSCLNFSASVVGLLEGLRVPVSEALSSWQGLDQTLPSHDAECWCELQLDRIAGTSLAEWRAALAARDGRTRLSGLLALVDELPNDLLDLEQFSGAPSGIEALRKSMRREAIRLVISEQPLVHILELWDAAVSSLTESYADAA